jgi:hypothetical protein
LFKSDREGISTKKSRIVFSNRRKGMYYNKIIVILATSYLTMVAMNAEASPAFARQTNLSCATCHFQHFPALNAFGRSFKQGAYTMLGGQSMIQSDNLSLPVALNASLITKLRYQKTNGSAKTTGTNTGELQFPDEAALVIGGRGGENVGILLEASLIAPDADTNFNSFKVHFNSPTADGTNLGAVVFLTDTGGAPYGFELLNTGAQRFMRVAEDRKATSAQQFIGGTGSPGASKAEGVAFVASRNDYFVNLSFWTPDHGSSAVNSFANYLRAAYMPTIGGWDTAIGMQLFSGTAKRVNSTTGLNDDANTDAWFVDGQAQGQLGGKPAGFYVTYGNAKAATNNYFNSNPNDQNALSLLGEYGFIPNKATVYLGYLSGDNGKAANNKDQRVSVGMTWLFAQNIELQLWNTSYSGDAYSPKPASGDNLTSVMLFAAF